MRPTSRAWERSDIDKKRDLMLAQKSDEFLNRVRGMPDREDELLRRLWNLRRS
jgi:hypothetical protein